MEKTCTKCKELKDLDCFSKRKRNKDGLVCACKVCNRASCLAYRRSRIGKIKGMYNKMIKRCETASSYVKNNRQVHFTIEDFLEFIESSAFDGLYDVWVESGYKQKFSPSIDRIDNNIDYTPKNIQILTQSENAAKDNRGEKSALSKLKPEEVISIRKMYGSKKYTRNQIGSLFGVTKRTISDITTRTTWKHI